MLQAQKGRAPQHLGRSSYIELAHVFCFFFHYEDSLNLRHFIVVHNFRCYVPVGRIRGEDNLMSAREPNDMKKKLQELLNKATTKMQIAVI